MIRTSIILAVTVSLFAIFPGCAKERDKGAGTTAMTASDVAKSRNEAIAAFERGDYATAMPLFRATAEQGDAQAQYYLGVMYHKAFGVPQDFSEAAKWTRKAAEQGDPMAQANLAWDYERGQGVPLDYAEAAAWYKKAAEQGHAAAQYNLATIFYNGQGVAKSDSIAVYWFYEAGMNNLKRGQKSRAQASLELIDIIDPKHELGERLRKALGAGTP